MKTAAVTVIVFSFVAASGGVVHAQLGATTIALSLNLHYTSLASPELGGSWALVAKTGSADGIAGVSAWISNINTAGMVTGNGGAAKPGYPGAINAVTIATIEPAANPGSPFNGTFGGFVNVLYGQNIAVAENGSIKLDVGGGAGTPGNIAVDPLRDPTLAAGTAPWDNAALLAMGTFGATRPAFGVSGSTTTSANVLAVGSTTTSFGIPAISAVVVTTVRDAVPEPTLGAIELICVALFVKRRRSVRPRRDR